MQVPGHHEALLWMGLFSRRRSQAESHAELFNVWESPLSSCVQIPGDPVESPRPTPGDRSWGSSQQPQLDGLCSNEYPGDPPQSNTLCMAESLIEHWLSSVLLTCDLLTCCSSRLLHVDRSSGVGVRKVKFCVAGMPVQGLVGHVLSIISVAARRKQCQRFMWCCRFFCGEFWGLCFSRLTANLPNTFQTAGMTHPSLFLPESIQL